MKISKNSWHYKFMTESLLGEVWGVPHSLCPYVRKLVMIFLTHVLVYGFLSICATGLVHLWIVLPFVWFTYGYAGLPDSVAIALPLAFGFSCSIVAISYGVVGGFKYLWGRLREKLKSTKLVGDKVVKEKDPSLFVTYIKAIHDRVCPLIDFKD